MTPTAVGDGDTTTGSTLTDLVRLTVDLGRVRSAIDVLAADLRILWSAALPDGHFDEIAGLVEASHAIHRAGVALRGELLPSF